MTLVAVGATADQALPVYTFMALEELLKYKAPVTKASPSLSTDGSDDLAPKYLSSKESKLAAADVALPALEVALLADAVALVAEAVAEVAAAVALVAASPAFVVAIPA